jgi:hypothetical protein
MLGQQVNSNLVEWPLHRTLKANTVLRSGGGSIRLATSQNISSKCRAGTTEHSCDCLGRGGVAKTSQKLKLRRKNVPVLRFWRPLRCDGLKLRRNRPTAATFSASGCARAGAPARTG